MFYVIVTNSFGEAKVCWSPYSNGDLQVSKVASTDYLDIWVDLKDNQVFSISCSVNIMQFKHRYVLV